MSTGTLLGRSLLADEDLSAAEVMGLLELADQLRHEKRERREHPRLAGLNIALVFQKASTRTRAAFEVAAHDQGARVTYFGPEESHLGTKESTADYARVLGRFYDGIEFRGYRHRDAEILAARAGVPVWNGLTDRWHPTQALADMLTMRDHAGKALTDVSVAYCGDTRNNTASSLLVCSALLGLDVRLAGPRTLWPRADVRDIADRLARASGARINVTDDARAAVAGCDFVYTDVWLSMGEPPEQWGERIAQLLAFQVNAELLAASGNPEVKFLHCLPAFHDTATEVGERLHRQFGLEALEVTDDVFESSASVVFDQAENRLHTIKALLVATLVE
jgi:ornithine carbamoyltransferase